MAATQYGTGLKVGATPALGVTVTNYYVQSVTENDSEVNQELVVDADGAPYTRIVKQVIPTFTMTAICKSGAAPLTDFPKGTVVTISGTYWMVESAPQETKAEPHTITVQLKKYNLNAV